MPVWTGPGRAIPPIVVRRSSVVHRETPARATTGAAGDAGEPNEHCRPPGRRKPAGRGNRAEDQTAAEKAACRRQAEEAAALRGGRAQRRRAHLPIRHRDVDEGLRLSPGEEPPLTLQVHNQGRAIVWSGSREVAELKRDQIRSAGPDFYAEQKVDFPLGSSSSPCQADARRSLAPLKPISSGYRKRPESLPAISLSESIRWLWARIRGSSLASESL